MEIIQLTGESGNVATHPLKHNLPTHIIFTGCYQTFQNDFNVWFIAYCYQDISWHECNSKLSASNRCYLTQQDQISRILAAMYHIHGLHAMPWMPLSYATGLNSPV